METNYGYSIQEFHCNKCPGYIIVRLNMDLNRRVVVVCPKCGRKHQRVIKDGVLRDLGKTGDEGRLEEIHVPKSAWSETPRTKIQEEESKKKNIWHSVRDGVVIDNPRTLIEESWFDRYGPASEHQE